MGPHLVPVGASFFNQPRALAKRVTYVAKQAPAFHLRTATVSHGLRVRKRGPNGSLPSSNTYPSRREFSAARKCGCCRTNGISSSVFTPTASACGWRFRPWLAVMARRVWSQDLFVATCSAPRRNREAKSTARHAAPSRRACLCRSRGHRQRGRRVQTVPHQGHFVLEDGWRWGPAPARARSTPC